MKKSIILALVSIFTIGCSQNKKDMKKPYVIEITSFKYKATVDANQFWEEDAKVEEIYTSRQPGYISRESGYSDNENEVVVVVRWNKQSDADASMQKFMTDESVKDYANMIEGSTMKMARYDVK